MAKKELPPPKLTVPRAEAAEKIKAQIEKGQALTYFRRGVTISDEEKKKAISEQAKWVKYNVELLARLFDNVFISEEYQSHIWGNLEGEFWSADEMAPLIFQLESILERLELIPEPIQASAPSTPSTQNAPLTREIFIVHGHDEAAKESVARVLSQLDLKPIILNEQVDAGMTIIEKFEKHANVAFAVVLLTPDDIGCAKKEPDQQKPRARQNVILEFGYFLGKLGRGKVCAFYKEGVELPSDLYGILYVSMDASGAWKFRLAKELTQAGIKVDINALLAD